MLEKLRVLNATIASVLNAKFLSKTVKFIELTSAISMIELETTY
jgi:hypothetical protein